MMSKKTTRFIAILIVITMVGTGVILSAMYI